jgi:hypothetical protein
MINGFSAPVESSDTTGATGDTYSGTHDFTSATVKGVPQRASITVEEPAGDEDISLLFVDEAVTIDKIVAVLVGSDTPSVTWTIRHGSDRSATGTEVVTDGTTTTNTSSGDSVDSFDDGTIDADSHLWLETTAQSGTVTSIVITIIYHRS